MPYFLMMIQCIKYIKEKVNLILLGNCHKLTEGIILEFKKIRTIKKLNVKFISLGNKIKIKLLLYFILSTIFLLFFWYYLSMFCAIYKYPNSFNKRYFIEFCYIFNRTIIYLFNTWVI